MIKIIKNNKTYMDEVEKDFNGDILYATKFIYKMCYLKDVEKFRLIHLGYIERDSWNTLESAGIDGDKFREKSIYKCPWINGNKYYWHLPVAIITQDNYDTYKERIYSKIPDYICDMVFDEDWMNNRIYSKMFDKAPRLPEHYPGGVQQSIMGHGYTDFTLPNDGSGSIRFSMAKLDNGDNLICYSWVWYNK